MGYDYIAGKKRIKEILDDYMEVEEVSYIPNDEQFTFKNAYYGWVTAVFVDIRNSTDLFTNEPQRDVARIIRCFTSEVIEILRDNDYLLEIGIRGDCVYSVYAAPTKPDEDEIFTLVCFVNTLLNMLNKLLTDKGLKNISVGIGMSTAQELVVKAGRKNTDINSKVWIGEAVTKAAKLSSFGNKNFRRPIIVSGNTYTNLNNTNKELCHEIYINDFGYAYDSDAIMVKFNNWIKEGMEE